jgi:hypothetical protein
MVNTEGDVVGPADLHPSLSRAPTTFMPARLILHIQGPISFTPSSLASEFLMFPFLVYDRLPRLGFAQLLQYHTQLIYQKSGPCVTIYGPAIQWIALCFDQFRASMQNDTSAPYHVLRHITPDPTSGGFSAMGQSDDIRL